MYAFDDETALKVLDGQVEVISEGDAVRVTGDAKLRRIAGLYEAKYGHDWHFQENI